MCNFAHHCLLRYLCLGSKTPFTRHNLLSNQFDNQLKVCIHDTTSCQTGLTTGCILFRFCACKTSRTIVYSAIFFWVLKPRLHHTTCCQTGSTTGCMFAYTIQPVVKSRLSKAGCETSCTTRFDNWLNEQWLFVQPVVKYVKKCASVQGCAF